MGLPKEFKVFGATLNAKQQQIGNGLTIPTGKPVGFLLSSFARNRTPFAGFGIQV